MEINDFSRPSADQLAMGLHVRHGDRVGMAHGRYIFDITHGDGRVEHIERDNVQTYDGAILLALLLGSGATPAPPSARGLVMLAVGTGATGPILSPDAPDRRQRRLNTELARKATSVVYRTSGGAVSAVKTNIVDFTATFGEGEAVGPWTEIALVRPISLNPAVTNPVPAVFPTYDTTIDLDLYDVIFNYGTFPVISKPSPMTIGVTYRVTLQ
jgi:hypothetical protein